MITIEMIFPLTYDKSRIKKVLIVLPLYREGLTSFLSPLLGQYGIRNVDFVTAFVSTFNIKTLNRFATNISVDDLEAGLSSDLLSVPVYLSVYKNGKYVLETGYSLVGSLFSNVFKKRRRFYRAKTMYRNLKKLLQLSVFLRYVELSSLSAPTLSSTFNSNCLFFAISDFYLKLCYLQIRNSVHQKC